MTPLQSAKYVARNRYAWPGGYPLFLVMRDGGALCPCCARSEFRSIARSDIAKLDDGWAPAAAGINYEDTALFCDHCGKQIESAYGVVS